jgi:osomolarity two-component system sensor histidine kinase SLN1
MPKMDGIESTRKIRELGFKAPIVALTAFDHETNRNACYEAGMNGKHFDSCDDYPPITCCNFVPDRMIEFLPKPIRRTALKKILEQFRPSETEDKAPP